MTIASTASAVKQLVSHMLLAEDYAATWEITVSYKARHTDNLVIPLLEVAQEK